MLNAAPSPFTRVTCSFGKISLNIASITALVAGVIREEEVYIPDGDFRLQIGDKAIVFALPEAKVSLEKLFH